MSGPVPSPSMKGTIGLSGTCRRPPERVIGAPSDGISGFALDMRSPREESPRMLLARDAAFLRIRVDVQDRARAEALLQRRPEAHRQEVRVLGEERLLEVAREAQERQELFREDVVLADVKPRL